jgi:hypothetical protein
MVSPDSQATACLPSGRNSTYRPVQISGASSAYGNNNRIVLTGQYFDTWGSLNLAADTKGWIAEIAYIPFISSFSPGWPWFNVRIGLQYTWYEQFGGTSVAASSNNTLFAYVWLAM